MTPEEIKVFQDFLDKIRESNDKVIACLAAGQERIEEYLKKIINDRNLIPDHRIGRTTSGIIESGSAFIVVISRETNTTNAYFEQAELVPTQSIQLDKKNMNGLPEFSYVAGTTAVLDILVWR